MDDTLPEAKKFLDQLYKKFTGEEKLIMASEMFDTARKIVLSSLPENLTENEQLKSLILRFYKDDFSEKQMKKILARIDELNPLK